AVCPPDISPKPETSNARRVYSREMAAAGPAHETKDIPMINPLTDAAGQFPGLSRIGALPADPGRAATLWSLMDSSARPAGEQKLIAGLPLSAGSALPVPIA